MALAHEVANATERAYRRERALEKRRELMAAWADYGEGKPARFQQSVVEGCWEQFRPRVRVSLAHGEQSSALMREMQRKTAFGVVETSSA